LDDRFDDRFFGTSRRQAHEDAIADGELTIIGRLFAGWHAGNLCH